MQSASAAATCCLICIEMQRRNAHAMPYDNIAQQFSLIQHMDVLQGGSVNMQSTSLGITCDSDGLISQLQAFRQCDVDQAAKCRADDCAGAADGIEPDHFRQARELGSVFVDVICPATNVQRDGGAAHWECPQQCLRDSDCHRLACSQKRRASNCVTACKNASEYNLMSCLFLCSCFEHTSCLGPTHLWLQLLPCSTQTSEAARRQQTGCWHMPGSL